MGERKIVHTRHVLAVKDLAVSAAYFKEMLGFDLDFTAPGWEFLSFGEFKVMLGECSDALSAHETGDHSWFAHALVENVDEVYAEFKERGAEIISAIRIQPWGIRDFTVRTPDGHRIVFGELVA